MLRSAIPLILGAALAPALSAQSCFRVAVGTDLDLFDDSTALGLPLGFPFTFHGVDYTEICVCSNGYIWFGPTAPADGDFSATDAELRAGAPRICPLWLDFNPAANGSGHVHYDNTVPGLATITWAGVYEFGRTTPIDLQVVLDAGSNIRVTYGANTPLGGTYTDAGAILVGASPGGGAAANAVTFAPRPLAIAQDTFHQFFAPLAFPYAGVSMLWSSTSPGYHVSSVPCTPGQLPPPARFDIVGVGCPVLNTISVYELFGDNGNPLDLSGTDFLLTPNGVGGYLVIPGLGGSFSSATSTALPAGDETTHSVALPFAFPHATGPYSNIYVSSNGFLTLGNTDPGTGCCTGSVADLLSGPPRVAAFWQDLHFPGGSRLFAQLDSAHNEFVVTWNRVPEFNRTSPDNTFQVALTPAGDIKIRLQSIELVNPGRAVLIGYSHGNGAVDQDATDLSAISGVLDLGATQLIMGLTQAAAPGSLPELGSLFTTEITGIAPAPNGNLTLLMLSTEIPPMSLNVLGLTGCNAYIALPEQLAFLHFTQGWPTTSFAVPIPLDPALAAQQLMSQAISDDALANPFGWRTSNGGRWTIGL